MTVVQTGLFIAGSYLVGSIPFGFVVGRLRGVDIRRYGSGSIGMTNVLRTTGPIPGLLVLLLDVAKGIIPVLLARKLTGEPVVEVLAALAVIAGHDFPVWLKFKGGKGVASTTGATLTMMPQLALVLVPVALLLLIRWRIVSVMSIFGSLVLAAIIIQLSLVRWLPAEYGTYALVAAPLIVVLHQGNIKRLLNGTEPKIGQSGPTMAKTTPQTRMQRAKGVVSRSKTPVG